MLVELRAEVLPALPAGQVANVPGFPGDFPRPISWEQPTMRLRILTEGGERLTKLTAPLSVASYLSRSAEYRDRQRESWREFPRVVHGVLLVVFTNGLSTHQAGADA